MAGGGENVFFFGIQGLARDLLYQTKLWFVLVGRDSGVADQHCTTVSPLNLVMQYLYATHQAP